MKSEQELTWVSLYGPACAARLMPVMDSGLTKDGVDEVRKHAVRKATKRFDAESNGSMSQKTNGVLQTDALNSSFMALGDHKSCDSELRILIPRRHVTPKC